MDHTGFLLDVYDDPEDGVVLWLLAESGERLRLRQAFPVTFYAAGESQLLRALWRWLEAQPIQVSLRRAEKRDLFLPEPLPVLAIEVAQAYRQPRLFSQASAAFPELTWYDADLPLALRHAAAWGTFPLAHLQVQADALGRVQRITPLDTRWTLDPPPPPLRILELEPDCDPRHGTPRALLARFGKAEMRLPLDAPRPLLVNLRALLQQHDPDLLLTAWGDTWLLPTLIELGSHFLPHLRGEIRTILISQERLPRASLPPSTTSADSSNGVAPVTTMDSATLPRSRLKSSVMRSFTRSSIESRTAFLKPACSAVTR